MVRTLLIGFALVQTIPVPIYFPQGEASISGSAKLSAFEQEWFGSHLAAGQEPSLHSGTYARPGAVRFLWLRSFHAPVIVRIEGLDGKSPQLVAKQLSGAGGYDPGTIAKQVRRPLTSAEAARLRGQARQAFAQPQSAPDELGTDGAQWIVERVDGRGYHLRNVWTPRSGAVRETGLAMLALTGWEFGEVY